MTQPIPRPQLLDPHRETEHDREDMTLEEHRARAQRLQSALDASCDYAQELWTDVARARQYLMDSLPPDPRNPGSDRTGTSPTGPDDDAGWARWSDAYSELTSVLAGPHGDSGFGAGEARQAAQIRREAPNAQLRAKYPAISFSGHGVRTTPDPAPNPFSQDDAADGEQAREARSRVAELIEPFKPALVGALLVLAMRGLRDLRSTLPVNRRQK